jgi:hypothetical protein
VHNVVVLDENPEGQEGPWITYARMVTLRTPKHLTGVETGIPSLTYRAWYEAQFGAEAWEKLDKIPRADWMEYLRWLRAVLELPVRNEAKVVRIEPEGFGLFRVMLAGGDVVLARKVVLATGDTGWRGMACATVRERGTTGGALRAFQQRVRLFAVGRQADRDSWVRRFGVRQCPACAGRGGG